MSELSNPEFWVGLGFCLVVVLLARPVMAKIKLFAQAQSDSVKNEIDESKKLRQEAEELYSVYENHTKNFEQEKESILEEGKREVFELQKESDSRLSKKIARKKEDVQIRIASIEENTKRDLTNEMMTSVMDKTKSLLAEKNIRQSSKDMDKAISDVLSILEQTVKK
ncbi:MAG: hypothetical protein J6V53_02055 [Alphaproteobacteria bacterium]|nr:hypothetical protein [Alphaproteobacteria bacterium]